MMNDVTNDSLSFDVLFQLESILDHDPCIDELGFVHSSQIPATSNSEDDSKSDLIKKELDTENKLKYDKTVFWIENHKLAICTSALPSLFKAAKSAYLSSWQEYKCLNGNMECDSISEEALSRVEDEVMKHSRVVVMLNSGYATAWNSRRQVVSRKANKELYSSELGLSELVLSFAIKCEQAWTYRRWLIILLMNTDITLKRKESILEQESLMVERIVERSKMNYRAWRHRCWLVDRMSASQILSELRKAKMWAKLNVGDNCCFHYCRCLLLRLEEISSISEKENNLSAMNDSFENTAINHVNVGPSWKEELEWNKILIQRYSGREALWIHRRFLFKKLIDMVSKNNSGEKNVQLFEILCEESELIKSCLHQSEADYDDVMKFKEHAVMYKLWIAMSMRQLKESTSFMEKIKVELITMEQFLVNVNSHKAFILKELFLNVS